VAHTVTCMHKHITNRARTMSKRSLTSASFKY